MQSREYWYNNQTLLEVNFSIKKEICSTPKGSEELFFLKVADICVLEDRNGKLVDVTEEMRKRRRLGHFKIWASEKYQSEAA